MCRRNYERSIIRTGVRKEETDIRITISVIERGTPSSYTPKDRRLAYEINDDIMTNRRRSYLDLKD